MFFCKDKALKYEYHFAFNDLEMNASVFMAVYSPAIRFTSLLTQKRLTLRARYCLV